MFNTKIIPECTDLYAQYIKEREGKEIVYHIEGGKPVGFATYKELQIDGRKVFYIVDIYVEDKWRKNAVATKMADSIASKAFSVGVEWLLGSVDINANGTEASVMTLLQYGFKIKSTNGSMIFFDKYLGVK